jgi:hypothetical protein
MKTRSKVITEKLENYYELNAEIKRLEKLKSNVKSDLLEYMQAHDANGLDAPGFIATNSPMTRASLDSKALGEYLGEKLDGFKKITHFNVFKVVRS